MTPQTSPPTNSVSTKELSTIKSQLRKSIKILKKHSVLHNGTKVVLKKLPWFLLIGTSGSGKTTLLANSKVHFLFEKKIKPEGQKLIIPTHQHDMWVTHNAIIFDVPGNYLSYKEKIASVSSKLWRHFLGIIKKFQSKKNLTGIIVALSLSDILDKQNVADFTETLKKRMQELQRKFGKQLPFYFTITKCDLLPGFLEFFSDYGSDELSQIWGVPLIVDEANDSVVNVFIARFNALISQLNKQLITRLHQEPNPHAKFFVKELPLQLEKLKNEFSEFLRVLTIKKEIFCLKGIYLTSALQESVRESPATQIQAISTDPLQNTLAILQKPIVPIQTYFIKQFLQGLGPIVDPKMKLPKSRHRILVYAFIISFILIGLFFYGKDVDQNIVSATQSITPDRT